jgi:hypothetical protein
VTDEELLKLIGPTGMREYTAATDGMKAEVRKFASTMAELDDIRFVDACARSILESARFNSWPGNWNGIHAIASACYTESKRRYGAAGHTEECRGDDLYQKGYARAYSSQGHTPPPPSSCDCGAE